MIDVSLRYKFYGVNETYECRMFDFIHHMIRVVVLVILHPDEKVSQLKWKLRRILSDHGKNFALPKVHEDSRNTLGSI